MGNMENCDECGKYFKSTTILKLYKRNIHVKIKCKLCNEEVGAGNFQKHKRVHHLVSTEGKDSIKEKDSKKSIDPLSQFQCNYCGKEFDKNKYLKAHIKHHEAGVKSVVSMSSIWYL